MGDFQKQHANQVSQVSSKRALAFERPITNEHNLSKLVTQMRFTVYTASVLHTTTRKIRKNRDQVDIRLPASQVGALCTMF